MKYLEDSVWESDSVTYKKFAALVGRGHPAFHAGYSPTDE